MDPDPTHDTPKHIFLYAYLLMNLLWMEGWMWASEEIDGSTWG